MGYESFNTCDRVKIKPFLALQEWVEPEARGSEDEKQVS